MQDRESNAFNDWQSEVQRFHQMRIVILFAFVILGANLVVDLLDSNMVNLIEERNQSIEKLLND